MSHVHYDGKAGAIRFDHGIPVECVPPMLEDYGLSGRVANVIYEAGPTGTTKIVGLELKQPEALNGDDVQHLAGFMERMDRTIGFGLQMAERAMAQSFARVPGGPGA